MRLLRTRDEPESSQEAHEEKVTEHGGLYPPKLFTVSSTSSPKASPPRLRLRQRTAAIPGVTSHIKQALRPPDPTEPLLTYRGAASAAPAQFQPRSWGPGGRDRPVPVPGSMAGLRGQGQSGDTCSKAATPPRPRNSGLKSPTAPPRRCLQWSGPARAAPGTERRGGRHHYRAGRNGGGGVGGGGPHLSSATERPPLKEKSGSLRKTGLRVRPARLPRLPTGPGPTLPATRHAGGKDSKPSGGQL